MDDNPPTSSQNHLTPHSLFPLSETTTTTTSSVTSNWLSNSSFTTDISAVNNSIPDPSHLIPVEEDYADEDKIENSKPKPSSMSYDILESSGSDLEERDGKRRTIKKNKKKKRKREKGGGDDIGTLAFGARKSGVRAWANSEIKPTKDYHLDSRGDPDNLAFGSLYRMDVVRYKLHGAEKSLDADFRLYSRMSNMGLVFEGEVDVDGLDSKLKSSGRYWSAKYSALERHRNFKHIRVCAPKKHAVTVFDDFIPLLDEDGNDRLLSGVFMVEESWEDEVMRKTKEFNKMTREQPHNVRVWLEFVDFQDKVASKQPQKGARLQTLEKKISILEKATELNPGDEDLLFSLLKTYRERDSVDVVISRWEKVLMQNPGSYKLWREFLHVIQRDFTIFKMSELRRIYGHAIQALFTYSKRHRQACPALELPSPDAVDIDLELGLVDVFFSLCRLEWQAGYHELATALLQAEMEYSLFSPPLQLTEQSKKRLFEHFWNSDGARIGEDGALGWSSWVEKEEENRQKVLEEMSSKDDEQGGWTGWFAPTSNKENSTDLENSVNINEVVLEDIEEEKEDESAKQEDDDDALLRMLGIDADAEANKEVHDTRTWVRWSEEELSRDHDQWMPIHARSGVSLANEEMEDGEEQLSRVVLFEDINDYLFSLSSTEARLSLVMQFIDFFGGQTPQCICTNSSSWMEKILSLETLPDSIIQHLRRLHLHKLESGPNTPSLELLLQDSTPRVEMMKFLRNASLLCLQVFPRNYKIEEAILIAEEQYVGRNNTSQYMFTPAQALARRLLKNDRQDILLCGIYAKREAAFGNIDHARKVFDMALSSMNGLPLETQLNASPLLSFWYSEMELVNPSNESESASRSLHILSCLGCGIPYSPYKGRPSSTQLLRAHHGFMERINTLKSSWSRHIISDSSIALICSSALFEELTAGYVAGSVVLSNALSMVLPERKSQSCQLEFLLNYHVRMLQRHIQEATSSKLWKSLSTGLQIYPCNPELFSSLLLLSHLYSVPNNLRRLFDELCEKKKASVMLCLFALSYELDREGSSHRIHGLFERALANDRLCSSVVLWRCYIAYEIDVGNFSSARRVFFRAIHACPWSKLLWLDGFQKLNKILSAKELMDLQEVMRDKELHLRTDIYEILLQDEYNSS